MKKRVTVLIFLLVFPFLFSAPVKEEQPVTESQFTVVDSRNLTISLKQKPQKIVSLSPNITEILFELGLGERVVGRTDYCDYPQEALKIVSVGDLLSPSVEKIVSLGTDLVIISNLGQKATVEALENAQIKVAYFNESATMDGTFDLINKVATLTGTTERADQIIREMQATLKEVEQHLSDSYRPTLYYVAGFGEWGDYTATGDTYINDIINLSGASNIAADATGWSYQREMLVAKDPDIILLPSFMSSTFEQTKKEFENQLPYSALTAVKSGKIITIENNLIERQSHRSALAVKELAAKIKMITE